MSKALTSELLYQRALHYLERYAASRAGVHTVLQRSVMRDRRRGMEVPAAAGAWIDAVLDRLQQAGYLNDRSFAETKLVSLRRAGASAQKIRQVLAIKGVAADTVADVLAGDESNDAVAAVALARRRRLGPFADAAKREGLRNRHLAALMRAGFSMTLARQVVDAASVEVLERELVDSR